MKKSVNLIRLLTVLLFLGVMVPMIVPQNIAFAAVSDNVSLTNFRFGPCNTWGTTAYLKSSGSVTCNVTVNDDAVENVNVVMQLFTTGSSTPLWTSSSYFYPVPSIGNTIFNASFTLPPASVVPANTYDVNVGVEQAGQANWKYSAKKIGAVIINNTGPTAPTLGASPAPNACVASQRPTFQWNTVTGAASYTLVIDGTDNMTCISSGASSQQISLNMTKASHTWSVKAVDAAGNATQAAETRTICIDTDPPVAPTESWVYSGLTFRGYNPTDNWTAPTDTSSCANIQYVVETSTDATFTLAPTDNVTVSGTSYTRSTLFPAAVSTGTTYYWRVRAFDCAGGASAWYPNARSFTMSAVSSIPYSINLSPGWNLISLPVIPDVSSTSTIGSRISPAGSVWLISSYACGVTPATYKYWILNPGVGALTTVVDGESYWVYATVPCTLSGTGRACPATPGSEAVPTIYQYTVCYLSAADGWDMLGFKCTQNMLASQYLNELSGPPSKYESLQRYAGGWVTVQPTDYLTPGTGYYIQMNTAGKITPPCY